MKIQYASDIHLEHRPSKFRRIIKPVGDILVLAGDIGYPNKKIYYQFLKWCKFRFAHVVLIPGNHEYYGFSIQKIKERLKVLSRTTGIVVLDRDTLELPDEKLVILGTTLWSYIPFENSLDVMQTTNDHRLIKNFDMLSRNSLYLTNRDWLKKTIEYYSKNNPEYKIIVVTHHAPVPEITSSHIHRGKSSNCAFASDCTDLMDGVDVWIFGHTHFNTTFAHLLPSGENVIITTNQRGYSHESIGYLKDQYILTKTLTKD